MLPQAKPVCDWLKFSRVNLLDPSQKTPNIKCFCQIKGRSVRIVTLFFSHKKIDIHPRDVTNSIRLKHADGTCLSVQTHSDEPN